MNLSRLPFVILSFFLCSSVLAQQDQNLVPNGHFEDYYMCPDDHSQIDRLVNWFSWNGTPDYYNSCDINNQVGIPLNLISGFQPARGGDGYAGFIGISYNNDREIIGTELDEPLTIGQEYYGEFYISRTFGGGFTSNCDCASSHIGMLFTTEPYFSEGTDTDFVLNRAQVLTHQLVVDSVNWVKVSGWFTADSAYTHLSIGTMYDLDSCQTAYFNGSPDVLFLKTYYYLEDVCVATDPAICDLWNSVSESENESLKIVRVGSSQIRLEGFSDSSQLIIFDQSGRVLETRTVLPEELINTNHLAAGVYILSVESGESLVTGRFVKY